MSATGRHARLRSAAVRAPVDHIAAPAFPPELPWINVAPLRMDQQLGRPVLIEFWDFCRPNSLRTLPYLRAWHERYEPARAAGDRGPRLGFTPSADAEAVRAAVARLEIDYPVVVDTEFEIWQEYGNLGWPARYLFNQDSRLFEYHYGEGGYADTELAIQELLGVSRPSRSTRSAPRTSRRRARRPERGRRGPLQRPLRGRRRVGGARRRRHGHAPTAGRSRSAARAPTR